MPELPEVETVRLQLEKEVLGLKIANIEVREAKIFIGDHQLLIGDKIVKIGRVGKYLFIYLKSKMGLIVHLKMTGRLVLNDPFYKSAKHTRVVIELSDKRNIYYWDTRKFGYLKLSKDIDKDYKELRNKLGLDPWKMTDLELIGKLKRTGRAIKEAILDQYVISGVGNIYANDALWDSKINPTKKANTLSSKEVSRLRASLVKVLERGIELGGASDNTYRDFYGGRGSYQDEFLVYGRGGEPCNRCGRALIRIVVGGRGTWMCLDCQA